MGGLEHWEVNGYMGGQGGRSDREHVREHPEPTEDEAEPDPEPGPEADIDEPDDEEPTAAEYDEFFNSILAMWGLEGDV